MKVCQSVSQSDRQTDRLSFSQPGSAVGQAARSAGHEHTSAHARVAAAVSARLYRRRSLSSSLPRSWVLAAFSCLIELAEDHPPAASLPSPASPPCPLWPPSPSIGSGRTDSPPCPLRACPRCSCRPPSDGCERTCRVFCRCCAVPTRLDLHPDHRRVCLRAAPPTFATTSESVRRLGFEPDPGAQGTVVPRSGSRPGTGFLGFCRPMHGGEEAEKATIVGS